MGMWLVSSMGIEPHAPAANVCLVRARIPATSPDVIERDTEVPLLIMSEFAASWDCWDEHKPNDGSACPLSAKDDRRASVVRRRVEAISTGCNTGSRLHTAG
jgi:hypothetical protein